MGQHEAILLEEPPEEQVLASSDLGRERYDVLMGKVKVSDGRQHHARRSRESSSGRSTSRAARRHAKSGRIIFGSHLGVGEGVVYTAHLALYYPAENPSR